MPILSAKRSIRGTLILLVMLTTGSTLSLALGINFFFESRTQDRIALLHANRVAAVTTAHAQLDIIKGNQVEASRQIKTFAAIESLESSQIYLREENNQALKLFASYTRSGLLPTELSEDKLVALLSPNVTNEFIELSSKITDNGELLGYNYLKISLQEFNQRNQNSLFQTGVIILFAILFALGLGFSLQKIFSDPIETLVDTIQQVDITKDYGLRAPQLSIDELNYLGQAFNRMLSRFSQRLEKQKAAEQEIMRLNQDLEEKVAKRTHALQLTNKELIDTLEQLHLYQGQVLEREKLLRLGDMVAEISHELNSPLGLGITTATTIQQSLHELKQSMQQSELSQRQLTEFLEQLDEACRILTRNLQRAGELIESFKHVAVDQCSEQDRTFNLKSFLNEVLLTLKPHLKKTRHQVHLFCPDNIVINSKPGALSQIIINLIQNSLQHGFQHIEQGNITISAAINSLQQLELVYQDDGCGMSDEIKKQVFAIYFTTAKDRGGSGMGMYLVQNIVYQLLGGELYLETSFNHGITLTIKIPTKMKDSFT